MKQSIFLTLSLLLTMTFNGYAQQTIYGDVNGDHEINIADINAVIDIILGGAYYDSGDVTCDSEINLADINAVIDIILAASERQ